MSDTEAPPQAPAHLVPVRSDRGFARYPAVETRSGTLEVYESSSAEGPHLWLGLPGGESFHVTAEQAWQFAEQLRQAVSGHYQGDARPEWATTLVQAGDWVRWGGGIVKVRPDERGNNDTNPFLDPGSLYRVESVVPPDYRGNASDLVPKLRLRSTADAIFTVDGVHTELVWRP